MSARWLWLATSCCVGGTGGACGARGNGNNCNCAAGDNTAVLVLQCRQPVPPDVQIVGACTVQNEPLSIAITTTYSLSVTASETWFACGSDPHGRGQQLVMSPASVSVGSECVDAGNDGAGFSD